MMQQSAQENNGSSEGQDKLSQTYRRMKQKKSFITPKSSEIGTHLNKICIFSEMLSIYIQKRNYHYFEKP